MKNCLNAEGVKPFVNTVHSTLEMMAGLEVNAIDCFSKKEDPIPGRVTGVVGLAGAKIIGSVSLKFKETLLLKIFSQMMGEEITKLTSEVYDTVAEIANIVAGGGKTYFASKKIHFNVTIPSVIIGSETSISYGEDATAVVVVFELDGEEFYMEIMMKKV